MLTIGNVNGGVLSIEFTESLSQTVRRDPGIGFLYALSPYLPENRNVVVDAFLAEQGDHLLFIDSDMAWEPEQIDQLVEDAPDGTVCSALYFHPLGSRGNASPVAWTRDGDAIVWQDGGMVEAAFTGAGFLLLPRSVIADIARSYDRPFECSYAGGEFTGEDLVFCQRLAALGHPLYVNCDVIVEHCKTVRLSPQTPVEDVVRLGGGVLSG